MFSRMVHYGHHDRTDHKEDDILGPSCSHTLVDSQVSEHPIPPLQLADLINGRNFKHAKQNCRGLTIKGK